MNAIASSPAERRSRLTDTLFLAVACFALRAVSLARSCLSDDEAIYAVVAREMLAGRVLYRDVVDHKPPLIYVIYAATQALGGPVVGMWLLHVLTILVVLATALLLGRIVRQFGGRGSDGRAPFHAALLYVVFTTTLLPFDSLAANCELFMMLPLTGSVLLFLPGVVSAVPRLGLLVGAGALVGVAVFFKYQGGIQLVLYSGTLAVAHRRRVSHAFLGSTAIAVGVVLVLGVGAAIMRYEGSLDAAWFWFRFNFSYIKEGLEPLETVMRAAVRVSFVAGSAALLWVLGIAAALKAVRQREVEGEGGATFNGFAAGWLAVSALATTAGGRFFGHYFHQVTAPLAVLAAPAAARLWRSPSPPRDGGDGRSRRMLCLDRDLPGVGDGRRGQDRARLCQHGALHRHACATGRQPRCLGQPTSPVFRGRATSRNPFCFLQLLDRAFTRDTLSIRSPRRCVAQHRARELGHVRDGSRDAQAPLVRRYIAWKCRGIWKVPSVALPSAACHPRP